VENADTTRPMDIPHKNGELVPGFSAIALYSYMAFPEDEAKRDTLFSLFTYRAINKTINKTFPDLTTSGSIARFLIDSPSLKQVDLEAAKESTRPGCMAACVLSLVLRLSEHCPEQASVNRAKYLVKKDLFPTNDEEITRAWAGYKNASHLWSVFLFSRRKRPKNTLYQGLEKKHFAVDELIALRADELAGFLAYAEGLRLLAENHLPPIGPTGATRSSHPLFVQGAMWSVDPAVLLPKKPAKKFPPIPARMQDLLKKYHA